MISISISSSIIKEGSKHRLGHTVLYPLLSISVMLYCFLYKPGACWPLAKHISQRPACAWFLNLLLSMKLVSMCVCVCVCVPGPRLSITSDMM